MDTTSNKILNKVATSDPVGHLNQMSQSAGEKFGKLTSNIAGSATRYMNDSREYVQENPAKGVALAAAAGLVAGSLLTLALRKRS